MAVAQLQILRLHTVIGGKPPPTFVRWCLLNSGSQKGASSRCLGTLHDAGEGLTCSSALSTSNCPNAAICWIPSMIARWEASRSKAKWQVRALREDRVSLALTLTCVGGGLPRYRPETSFTFETGDIVYMY
jgi:hypothetical protein